MESEINQQAIKHIIEAMNDDSLIIFVGAGVSANSGLPNWDQLIDKFREELLIEDSETDNIKVAQFYYDMWGKQKYLQKITNIFNEYSSAQPNEIHNHIYKIQPKHIITTNYDSLIGMATPFLTKFIRCRSFYHVIRLPLTTSLPFCEFSRSASQL